MKRLIVLFTLLILLVSCTTRTTNSLPLPEISDGVRGDLLIDKNINEETIDNYLNRSDAVYRDLRMLVDDANFEAIDGSSIVDGIVEGFEIVPYPYLCNVTDLPLEVGDSYTGNTLFTKTDNGYKENYDESLLLLNNLFPKDKIIFLMCGGGGYAGKTKDLLIYYGYDPNKIYNVGGYWYYNGDHKQVIRKEENGNEFYDMNNVVYHNIDFNTLKPKDDYVINEVISNSESFKELEDINVLNDELTLIFVYLKGCSACKSFKTIINDVLLYNDLNIYQIEFNNLESFNLDVDIKYAPSLIIIKNKEVISYLDASKDSDKQYYKKSESLSKWLSNYVDINTVLTPNINNEECDDITCGLE